MKRILEVLIISLAMTMVVSAITPADVVRDAKEAKKPSISTQGVNASVFKTEPFEKDTKRTTPLANNNKAKNFTTSFADESVMSENAAKEWVDNFPGLPESMKESFHRNNTTVGILGPVLSTTPELEANDTLVDDVINWLNRK